MGVTAVPIALAAVSTAAGYATTQAAASQAKDARNKAATEQAQIQSDNFDKSLKSGQSALNQYGQVSDAETSIRDKLAKVLLPGDPPTSSTVAASPADGSTDPVIADDAAHRKAGLATKNKLTTDALAHLNATGQALSDAGYATAPFAEDGVLANMNSRSSAALLPYQLQAANEAGAGMTSLGSLFTGAGKIAGASAGAIGSDPGVIGDTGNLSAAGGGDWSRMAAALNNDPTATLPSNASALYRAGSL